MGVASSKWFYEAMTDAWVCPTGRTKEHDKNYGQRSALVSLDEGPWICER